VLALAVAFGAKSVIDGVGASRLPLRDLIAAGSGIALAMWHPGGRDDLSFYYLEGLCGFPTRLAIIIPFIALNGAIAWLLQAYWRSLGQHERYGLMLLTFYSQLMFIYYIWGGSRFHLLNYCAIFAMTTLYLVQLTIAHVDWAGFRKTQILGSLKLASLALLLVASANFVWQECAYRSIFKDHRTYVWELPRARIVTTMPEKPFADAASLIDRYSSQAGIAILSEYDIFLPFLAGRYSDLPYPDLQWYVMSDVEKQQIVDQLRRDRPRYLFADRDLMRELSYEVINCHVPLLGVLQAESILRVRRLRVIQDIFREVSADYQQVDAGGLLAVWELRDAR
jgi:hypothetical protein